MRKEAGVLLFAVLLAALFAGAADSQKCASSSLAWRGLPAVQPNHIGRKSRGLRHRFCQRALRTNQGAVHDGANGFRRHDPGAQLEEDRRHCGINVDHRGAVETNRLYGQVLSHADTSGRPKQAARWHPLPRTERQKLGVQRGTTHDQFVSKVFGQSDIQRYANQDDVFRT